MSDEKNIKLFDYYLVLSEVELLARQEVALEQYEMAIDIEAETLESMARTMILPAAIEYLLKLQAVNGGSQNAGISDTQNAVDAQIAALGNGLNQLSDAMGQHSDDALSAAFHRKDNVIPAMEAIRDACDNLEKLVPANLWPVPTYAEILFVR